MGRKLKRKSENRASNWRLEQAKTIINDVQYGAVTMNDTHLRYNGTGPPLPSLPATTVETAPGPDPPELERKREVSQDRIR